MVWTQDSGKKKSEMWYINSEFRQITSKFGTILTLFYFISLNLTILWLYVRKQRKNTGIARYKLRIQTKKSEFRDDVNSEFDLQDINSELWDIISEFREKCPHLEM